MENDQEPLVSIEKSKFRKFRESKKLVVAVVFVAMMLDLIVLTSIDPLLPNILLTMDEENRNHSLLEATNNSIDTTVNSTNNVETRVGIIIALKPATEVVANIIVGAIVAKFGHKTPMITGCLFNTISTLGFAYAPNFWCLIIARICQAAASSLSVISGLALVSSSFQDETERSKAISHAFGGLSLGIVLGYPFGSVTYQFLGRKFPFIALAALSLLDGIFRLMVAKPEHEVKEEPNKNTAYLTLLCDPCILSALICNFTPNLALGVFLATGPAWMLSTLHGEQWQIGTVLAIAMLFQLVTQFLTGIYGIYKRWLFCMIGMWIYSIGMCVYPLCFNVWMVTIAEILTRSGFGMIICVISPLLSYLVDIRHQSNYGEVFGLYTASYNIGLTIGPLLGGLLLNYITFSELYRGTGVVIFVSSFLVFVFRNPPHKPPIIIDKSQEKSSLKDEAESLPKTV